jgi:hypothetical protein
MQAQTPDMHTQLIEAGQFWLTKSELLRSCKQQG